jgi:hypothetical protein
LSLEGGTGTRLALENSFAWLGTTLGLNKKRQVVETRRRIGMVGAEHLLADRQRALVERSRPGEITLGLEQKREVVEARRRIGMVGAEHLLADRQRALVERSRPGEITGFAPASPLR